MLTETEGLNVCIDESGTSSYSFQHLAAKASATGLAHLKTLPHGKGIGTTANTAWPKSTPVYTEQTVALCVIGENEAYICKYCYVKISLKAKARDDFPRLTFCSDDCLKQAGPYLDFCGFVGNEMNRKQWGDVSSLIQLAVHCVYSVSIANTAHSLARALQVLELESHPGSISTTDTLNVAAQWLYTYFKENLSPSTVTALATRGFYLTDATAGTALLSKLLRIIKYNAQAVPIHGVPKAQLLCLLPSVARLNHSCAPNCALLYDVYRTTVPNTPSEDHAESAYSLRLTVLSLRDMLPGEELTMSYIQPLCGSTDFRRTLLQQGFLFECQCERCNISCVSMHFNEQRAMLDKKLQTIMQSAQSSQKAISYVSLAELLTSAESLLEQVSAGPSTAEDAPSLTPPPISEIHDAASFVLQQSLLTLKVASTGGTAAMDAVQQGKVLELTVRASLTLSHCWDLTRCANLLQRIEIAVSGSNYAVQLQRVERAVRTKYACIKLFKKELERVIQVLVNVYHCDQPGKLVESAIESNVSIGSMTSIRVQRESSTLPYLCKLYRKAVENYEQLK